MRVNRGSLTTCPFFNDFMSHSYFVPTFSQTVNPCPFGFFNSDSDFISEADSIVIFVKQQLGDSILSVELTSKQIWSCFELATLEYSRYINELKTKNDLINVLGLPTGSTDITNVYTRKTFEYINRLAEPYSQYAGAGGSFNTIEGYFTLEPGRQDYDLYKELRVFSGSMSGQLVVDTLPSGSKGKMTVLEVMHFEPVAAQTLLLNASNITQFLSTEFNFESYVNSTVFYVLPVFEDVLRRSMLETAFRVRRSNFSYRLVGSMLRLYPCPNNVIPGVENMFVRVFPGLNPTISGDPDNPTGVSFQDDSMSGVSGPSNFPVSFIPYSSITEPGRQWIRMMALALAKELLGLVRSKFDTVPIPNAELKLNGPELVQQGREEKEKLVEQLKEFLAEMSWDKITEREATIAENLQKSLRYTVVPLGKAITIG